MLRLWVSSKTMLCTERYSEACVYIYKEASTVIRISDDG